MDKCPVSLGVDGLFLASSSKMPPVMTRRNWLFHTEANSGRPEEVHCTGLHGATASRCGHCVPTVRTCVDGEDTAGLDGNLWEPHSHESHLMVQA